MTTGVLIPGLAEVSAMGAAELERALVELERTHRSVMSAIVDVMDVADRERVWATDGHRGVRNWAIALTGISPSEAARRCQLMRALRELEVLRDRLRSGEVGVCQARELARVHANVRVRARLARAEELLVQSARRRSFSEFHHRLGRWTAAADPRGTIRHHDDVHAGRHARVRITPKGVTLTAHGGTAQGALLLEIFAAYVDAEFDIDWAAARELYGDHVTTAHLARTGPQREFDALHAIFLASVEQRTGGGGVSAPTVNIVIDQSTFEAYVARGAGGPPPPPPPDPNDFTRRCETDRGIPIDPRDAVAAALIGRVRRVVYDSAGVVIDLGRTQRLFTGSAREAVWLQGRQCLWPGCGVSAREQDHLEEWVNHGGCTRPGNGGPMCGCHNRWKHRGYRIWRNSDGACQIERPDGTSLCEPRAG